MYLGGAMPLTGFFGQPTEWREGRNVGDEHPVEEPGSGAPAWAVLPTMPWTRVVPSHRHSDTGVSSPVAPAEDEVDETQQPPNGPRPGHAPRDPRPGPPRHGLLPPPGSPPPPPPPQQQPPAGLPPHPPYG